MRIEFIALVAMLSLPCLGAGQADAADTLPITRNAQWVPDEVVVGFRNVPRATELAGITRQLPAAHRWDKLHHCRRAKGSAQASHPLASVRLIKLKPGQDVQRMAQRLSRMPGVAFAHPNYIMRASFTPNDPFFSSQQYAPQIIRAEEAWDLTLGDPEVIIAIADSGLRFNHEEFVDAAWVNEDDPVDGVDNDENGFVDDNRGWDFTNGDNNPTDDFGHGTHVTGIAVAGLNNGVGIAGLSKSKVMVLKVFDGGGDGTWLAIAEAIAYAVDNGARVLNYSGGGSGGAGVLANMVTYAHDNDMSVVAAAGNQGSNVLFFPAAYPGTIAVSATTAADVIWPSSNSGDYIDVAAPGGNIFSTWHVHDSDYRLQSGTSMATPHVTGLIALMYSLNPDLQVEEIRTLLQENAVDLGPAGFDEGFGWGRIDAADTLAGIATIDFSYPDGLPETTPPLVETVIRVAIQTDANDLDPESPTVHCRINDDPFVSFAMTNLGGGMYEATLPPAECQQHIDFYFSAATVSGTTQGTSPRGAPEEFHTVHIGVRRVFIDDDFELDQGWETSFGGGEQTSGQWVRVDPIGTDRQPEDDFSEDGTLCYVTGNCVGGAGTCDVDGGPVVLTSPQFSLFGSVATVSYARWFNNSNGGDSMIVEVSNDDGQSWVELETVGPGGAGGWDVVEFDVSSFVALTDEMRVRFTTEDVPPFSVTEAAIDEFLAHAVICDADPVPPVIVHDGGLSTFPFSGYIDPRNESSDGSTLDRGIDSLVITFSKAVRDFGASAGDGITRAAFSITGVAPSYPEIASVEQLSDTSFRLNLAGPIPVGEWTTIVADVEDLSGIRIEHPDELGPDGDEPDRIDIGFLPCDVDQDGAVRPIDLLRFRQIMQGTLDFPKGEDEDYVDVDRNGLLQPLDLLRFRQLFVGSGDATRVWGIEVLGARP